MDDDALKQAEATLLAAHRGQIKAQREFMRAHLATTKAQENLDAARKAYEEELAKRS